MVEPPSSKSLALFIVLISDSNGSPVFSAVAPFGAFLPFHFSQPTPLLVAGAQHPQRINFRWGASVATAVATAATNVPAVAAAAAAAAINTFTAAGFALSISRRCFR